MGVPQGRETRTGRQEEAPTRDRDRQGFSQQRRRRGKADKSVAHKAACKSVADEQGAARQGGLAFRNRNPGEIRTPGRPDVLPQAGH